MDARSFEQLEIMPSPLAEKRTDNLPSKSVNYELTFERVPFLFAAIKGTLVPLRTLNASFSHINVATVGIPKPRTNWRFPGSRKRRERIKVSSTQCTIRQTVDSLMPQLVAM